MNILILASTFRHYYLSVGLALGDPDNNYHLVFIDQLQGKNDNKLFKVVKELAYPFASVDCLPTKAELGSKRLSRKFGFQVLKKLVEDINPEEIITGNDRRVEFQFSMDTALTKNTNVIGSFIDDGTGSYLFFQDLNRWKLFSDKYIDLSLKKIVYGNWYERPERLGSSSWIQKCYLAHPEFAPSILKKKKIKPLISSLYTSTEVVNYYSDVIEGITGEGIFSCNDSCALILLPHSSLIMEVYGTKEHFFEMVDDLKSQVNVLYFKYHPRDFKDPLELHKKGKLLPSFMPAELYLSIYEFDIILGDVSTALMSAKWLRKEANVQYFPVKSELSERVGSLFSRMGIDAAVNNRDSN